MTGWRKAKTRNALEVIGSPFRRAGRNLHRSDAVSALSAKSGADRVRRLPVLDCEGALCGPLSIDDVLAMAGDAGNGFLSERDALAAFQEICHRTRGPRTLSEPAPRP